MKAYYQIIVSDKNGKVIKKYNEKLSKSYLFQWLKIMTSLLRRSYGSARYPISDVRDITNTLRTFTAVANSDTTVPALDCPAENDAYGIVVGTGEGALANENYALTTKILTGAVAGKLVYSAHTWINPAIVGENVDFRIIRNFSNLSGDTITIKEIGIYCFMLGSATSQGYCLLRDLITPVDLEDTKTITVIYILRTKA